MEMKGRREGGAVGKYITMKKIAEWAGKRATFTLLYLHTCISTYIEYVISSFFFLD